MTLPRLDAFWWMGCSVGRKRSPCDVFRIRSKNGTDPFLGKPETWVVNAGCDALRGMLDFVSSVFSSASQLNKTIVKPLNADEPIVSGLPSVLDSEV